MFEFLFKRPGDNKPGDKPAGQEPQAEQAASTGSGSAAAPQRALQAEKLSQVQGDEAAAVEFILQCEFSELRLAAAEFVHSPELLERVHTAMRNTDRRVAKLMQSRLDAHRHREAERRRGETMLEQARSLLKDELLTPNHVADLDRKWAVIAAPGLQEEFGQVRAALAQRLEAQVQLQRAMIDRLASLRRLPSEPLPAAGWPRGWKADPGTGRGPAGARTSVAAARAGGRSRPRGAEAAGQPA
jgi:ATP-dependent Clp protease ATP-binding subunit ClpA